MKTKKEKIFETIFMMIWLAILPTWACLTMKMVGLTDYPAAIFISSIMYLYEVRMYLIDKYLKKQFDDIKSKLDKLSKD